MSIPTVLFIFVLSIAAAVIIAGVVALVARVCGIDPNAAPLLVIGCACVVVFLLCCSFAVDMVRIMVFKV